MYFIIVEDLSSDCNHLLHLIEEYCTAHAEAVSFTCYENAESFLEDYRPGYCNAIFLDILLEKLSGIGAAKKVRQVDERVPIVFTSGEKSFSFESYRVHALDFLLKPVRSSQLSWCMDQILKSMAAPLSLTVPEARSMEGTPEQIIPLEQLVYVESIRNGLLVHTTSGVIRTSQRLTFSKIVQLLPKNGQFCIFCRGQLVNFAHVSGIGSRGEIRLKNGQVLYCSRRKIREILSAFAEYRIMHLRKGGVPS